MIAPNDGQVARDLFRLTRAALDSPNLAVHPYLTPEAIIGSMSMHRIERLTEFWKNEQGIVDDAGLTQRVEDVLAGFHSANIPWVFVLRGSAHGIECGFGLADDRAMSTMHASLPGSTMSRAWNPLADGWQPQNADAASLTGVPTRKADHLERVSRALSGGNWLYVVFAHPKPNTDIRAESVEAERELSACRQMYAYKDATPNAAAERLVELLQQQTKRFQHARALGMWSAYSALWVDGAERRETAIGLLRSAFAGKKSVPEPLRARHFASGGTEPEEPNTWTDLTTSECATLATPLREDQPGFEVVPDTRFGVQAPLEAAGSIRIGSVIDRGAATGGSISISMRDVTKHGLIVGVTGAGKTNTCFELLAQTWRGGEGVPFMVLESAKSEYRDLLNDERFAGTRVYTIGNETLAPIRINPFRVADGILVQSHIDFLKALFSAAFVLYPPMPYVLDQALHEVYQDFGWDLVTNTNVRGSNSDLLFPTLDDLIEKTQAVVKGLGYDTRLEMDIQAGLTARLDGLRRGGGKGPMLNTRSSISDADLFEKPCVLELKALVTDEEKAFFIGLILIRLHEYYESRPGHRHDGGLRHVTLIEEAHRLLRNVSTDQSSDVSANPKGQAVEVFGNMLAEIRAYGEGVLIAEQVPTKLLPDAIKNTNLKIVHRLVAKDDRTVVGETMNLDDEQMGFLTTLRTGEAVVYAEGMRKPALVRVGLAAMKRSGGRVSDDRVHSSSEIQSGAVCVVCNDPSRNRKMLSDQSFEACRAIVQSLRFAPLETQSRLNHAITKCSSSGDAHCNLLLTATFIIEKIARLQRWNISTTSDIISGLTSLFSGFPYVELSVAQNLHSQISAAAPIVGPKIGCERCLLPCQVRFDVQDEPLEGFDVAYNSVLAEPEQMRSRKWEEAVITPLIDRFREALATYDETAQKSAAYCFVVHRIHEVVRSPAEAAKALRATEATLR